MATHLSREEIFPLLKKIVVDQLGVTADQVQRSTRPVEDLGCDSLDAVELVMAIEDEFEIEYPDDGDNHPALDIIFRKADLTFQDIVDIIYMQSGRSHVRPKPTPLLSSFWFDFRKKPDTTAPAPKPTPMIESFTHWDETGSDPLNSPEIYTDLGRTEAGFSISRRNTDGICSIQIPTGNVCFEDSEEPVPITGFRLDIEPVSTTAYARFLNSIGEVDKPTLALWLALAPADRRGDHQPLEQSDDGEWKPKPGTERWPMILVSWYGANAYALWANREDWTGFRNESPFLPGNRQFEYAARGKAPRRFPWGDTDATAEQAVVEKHRYRANYSLMDLPISDVNACYGMSPFGLRHMAGNVWQWCREWVDEEQTIRSERGGSWIGAAALAECRYGRGRIPGAKGRCLGFRCAGKI